MRAKPKAGQDWQIRHNEAVDLYCTMIRSHEHSFLKLLAGWKGYADSHKYMFESCIGDDNVLGPAWEVVGDGLRELLNGEVGPRLDCGTLDSFIYDTMKDNGVDVEGK